MSVSAKMRLKVLLDRCRNNPHRFNEVFLGGPSFDPDPGARKYQREICRSVVQYRTTVVYSGNMLGKDYVFARLLLWWLYTRKDSLVIATGPTQQQIGSIVWKEVRRAVRRAPVPFQAHVTAAVQASPQQVNLGGGWQALGFSTKSVERASGQHSGALLVLVIEGSGVEEEVWDAIESLGYDRLAINGNPIRADGRFVDLIRQAERDRDEGIPPHHAVNAIRIRSTESPHAMLEKSPVGLADRTWLEATRRRYGKNSLYVRSHIEAEIPTVSSDILIPEAHLDWAATRPVTSLRLPANHPIHATRRLACDLGEGVGRDSTAIVVRDDWGVLDVIWGSTLGLAEAADRIYRMAVKWGIPPDRISFDVAGIGRNMPLHLKRHGIVAVPYSGAGLPRSEQFTNLRTEAAWNLANRLDPQGADDHTDPHRTRPDFAIPPGDYWHRLRTELKALTYDLVGNRTRLLSKQDWCTVLGHSPDLADALIQSFS